MISSRCVSPKHSFTFLALILFVCLVSCSKKNLPGIGSADQKNKKVSWQDDVGDTANANINHSILDVREVSVWEENGFLVMEVETANSIEDHLKEVDSNGHRNAGAPVEFLIDLDQDKATGGKITWADEAKRPMDGYDLKISVYLGFVSLSQGSVMNASGTVSVDTAKSTVLESFAKFVFWNLRSDLKLPDSRQVLSPFQLTVPDLCSISKNKVQIRVPLQCLGVGQGKTLRLCWYDYYQSNRKNPPFSDDRILTLTTSAADLKSVVRREKPWDNLLDAVEKGNTAEVKRLMGSGITKELFPVALLRAGSYGHREIIDLLLSEGVDVNTADMMGQTPLFMASAQGREDLILYLLEKGAAPNGKTSAGETALHRVVMSGNVRTVSALLKAGADIHAKSEAGHTPLELAEMAKNEEIVSLLKSSPAPAPAGTNPTVLSPPDPVTPPGPSP
ncbi:MAG: ankyrin repeat domain-containing protein [Verrucomicrobiae bacterium]|nr:ankyrin repeat domain-containing protein [Verrucomicrobiae bacterium]